MSALGDYLNVGDLSRYGLFQFDAAGGAKLASSSLQFKDAIIIF